MNMIGGDHIIQNVGFILVLGCVEPLNPYISIKRLPQQKVPVMTAVCDMPNLTRKKKTNWIWHFAFEVLCCTPEFVCAL